MKLGLSMALNAKGANISKVYSPNQMNKILSSEAKLKAVIEAQCAGGCEKWSDILKERAEPHFMNGTGGTLWYSGTDCEGRGESYHLDVITILLDTEGCKAAYGEGEELPIKLDEMKKGETVHVMGRWKYVSERILDAWHSSSGNNWQKAIDIAYQCLNIETCTEENV